MRAIIGRGNNKQRKIRPPKTNIIFNKSVISFIKRDYTHY